MLEFVHTVGGSYLVGGFFVMGISAWHLLRGRDTALFQKSFRLAAVFTFIFALFTAINGDLSGKEVAEKQPSKLAAMESHWQTQKAAPMYLFVVPDEKNSKNAVEILPIPSALSFLAFGDFKVEVKGLNDIPPADRPPVTLTFLSFRIMVGLGTLFIILAGLAWLKRKKLLENRWLLSILVWTIPLPYLALQAGWAVAEVGRQPWIVWGLMRTADAVSPIAASQVAVSLTAFILVYGLLGLAAFFLLFKYARKGPAPLVAEGR